MSSTKRFEESLREGKVALRNSLNEWKKNYWLGLQWHQSQFFPAHFHLLLLPVSTGVEYNSALFPVDCSLPANSSCREAAIAFILFFHIDNSEVAAPIINQFHIRSMSQSHITES